MISSVGKYNSLGLHQRAVLLGAGAVFLMNLRKSDIVYSLYSYRNFYIEVLIEDETDNLIDIVAFEDLEKLDKYLDKIFLIGV